MKIQQADVKRCDWFVRRAKGDKFVFEPCNRPGKVCTDGPSWQHGAVRCKRHTFVS